MKMVSFLVATIAIFSTTAVIAAPEAKPLSVQPTAVVTLHTNDPESTATLQTFSGPKVVFTLSNSNPKQTIPIRSGMRLVSNIYTIKGFSKGTTCQLAEAHTLLHANKSYIISLHGSESNTSPCHIELFEKK